MVVRLVVGCTSHSCSCWRSCTLEMCLICTIQLRKLYIFTASWMYIQVLHLLVQMYSLEFGGAHSQLACTVIMSKTVQFLGLMCKSNFSVYSHAGDVHPWIELAGGNVQFVVGGCTFSSLNVPVHLRCTGARYRHRVTCTLVMGRTVQLVCYRMSKWNQLVIV